MNGKDIIAGGTESVLSRWKVSGCANWQQHLGVKAYVPLVGLDRAALSTVHVGLHGHGKSVDDINNDRSVGSGWRLGDMELPHGINLPSRSEET
jgi:hypothetical protein